MVCVEDEKAEYGPNNWAMALDSSKSVLTLGPHHSCIFLYGDGQASHSSYNLNTPFQCKIKLQNYSSILGILFRGGRSRVRSLNFTAVITFSSVCHLKGDYLNRELLFNKSNTIVNILSYKLAIACTQARSTGFKS